MSNRKSDNQTYQVNPSTQKFCIPLTIDTSTTNPKFGGYLSLTQEDAQEQPFSSALYLFCENLEKIAKSGSVPQQGAHINSIPNTSHLARPIRKSIPDVAVADNEVCRVFKRISRLQRHELSMRSEEGKSKLSMRMNHPIIGNGNTLSKGLPSMSSSRMNHSQAKGYRIVNTRKQPV